MGHGERTGTEPESDSHCKHGREWTSQGEREIEERTRRESSGPPFRKVRKEHQESAAALSLEGKPGKSGVIKGQKPKK